MIRSHSSHVTPKTDPLQAAFVMLLPAIQQRARVFFHHVSCAQTREDHVAEVVAIAWRWYTRLAQKGKDASRFVATLAWLAARAVRSGRRLTGQESSRDVLSSRAQRRHQFTVSSLPQTVLR
jgi:hypothetical protein